MNDAEVPEFEQPDDFRYRQYRCRSCSSDLTMLLGFAAESGAAWNAWIVGAAIALIAAAALYAFYEVEEWVNLVLGVWAVVAPWVLGFAAVTAAMWVHLIVGVVVAVVAAGSIWFSHNHPLSTV